MSRLRLCQFFLFAFIAACSSVPVNLRPTAQNITNQEKSFAAGLVFLRSGNENEAIKQFENVVELPVLTGITDEAIFRLALLVLNDDTSSGGHRAKLLLDRLKSEFPESIWYQQSRPVSTYLNQVKKMNERQRELKGMREQNLSLSRDNKELRQNIERLKALDRELEQKMGH